MRTCAIRKVFVCVVYVSGHKCESMDVEARDR